MLRCLRFIGCLLLLTSVLHESRAQDPIITTEEERQETEVELKSLENQIRQYEAQLADTRRQERSALSTLEELNREIVVRQRLVTTYNRRNRQLETERVESEQTIADLEKEVQELEEQYRSLLIHAYKHKRMKYLSLLLTSQSLNQMLIRMQYLRRFSERREVKRKQIDTKTDQLIARQAEVRQMIQRNADLADRSIDEQAKLTGLQQERSQVLKSLTNKRSQIQKELNDKRGQAEQLRSRMQSFITAETERVEEETTSDPIAAEEFTRLAATFSKNRGALPWPVQGVVTESFGKRIHPEHRTETLNVGIEIATSPGALVRAIFDGVVTQVFIMPGYGTCAMIRHGDYFTVSSNFSSLSVKQGDLVYAGQEIGRAGTEAQPKGSALFFALFNPKGKEVNPIPWLRKR